MAAASPELADKRIPILIIALLCCLAWAIGAVTREPWPFPIFPGFGTVHTSEAAAAPEVRRVFVVHGEDRAMQVDLDEMFADVPNSFFQPMTESFASIDVDDINDRDAFEAWVNTRAHDQPAWAGGCVSVVELIELTANDQQVGTPLKRIEFSSCQ